MHILEIMNNKIIFHKIVITKKRAENFHKVAHSIAFQFASNLKGLVFCLGAQIVESGNRCDVRACRSPHIFFQR